MSDYLTVLKSKDVRVTKLWRADGTIDGAPAALNFLPEYPVVDDIHTLHAALTALEGQPNALVIRGTPKPDAVALSALEGDANYSPGYILRRLAVVDDVAHNWVMFDVDGFVSNALTPELQCIDYISQVLPPEFHHTTFHWQLSSSAGHATVAAGVLKAHIWFWLERPYTSPQLAAWAKYHDVGCDRTVFRTVQPHFTANPLFDAGIVDPVARRSGLGLGADTVSLDIPFEVLALAETLTSTSRRQVLDAAAANDPVARMLDDRGDIRGRQKDGALFVRCPRRAYHTSGDGAESSTMYYPANTGGFAKGSFVCLHDHCTGVPQHDFIAALGMPRENPFAVPGGAAPVPSGEVTVLDLAHSQAWCKRCSGASETELRTTILAEIQDDTRLDLLDRQRLAKIIQERLKTVFGIPVSINDIRRQVLPRRARADMTTDGAPDWLARYAYITTRDKFIHLDRGELTTRGGFQGAHNRLMPMRDDGQRDDAARAALERWNVPAVQQAMYLPGAADIFEWDGKHFANLYSVTSVPVDTAVAGAARPGIEAFERQLWVMSGQRFDVYSGLLYWMAHLVQYPGKKIRFMPLIKGVEGDGKSIIASVIGAAIGTRNLLPLSPDIIGSSFSDFSHGHSVVAIEEIMLYGKDRFAVLNKIKPYITNDEISVHPKGGAPFKAINTTNYVGFTNYPDAVPLHETDRRWWVIFSPCSVIDDMWRALGLPDRVALNGHFTTIFNGIRDYPGSWRAYFMGVAIPAAFNPNGAAPDTAEKHRMISSSRDESELLAREIIAEGVYGVTPTVLSSSCLSTAMVARGGLGFEVPKSHALNFMLTRLGFEKKPDRVKWDNQTHRIWGMPGSTNNKDEIRALLDAGR